MSRLLRRADDDAHPDVVRGGKDQRDFQGEFRHGRAPDEVARPQREVQIGGGGYDDLAERGVIGEPVVGPQGPQAGELHLVGAGVVHHGAEQRVFRRGQSGGGHVPGACLRLEVQPVPVPLERVRREVDRAARAAQGSPVDGPAPDVELGQCAEQGLHGSAVAPRRGEDQRVVHARGGERLSGDAGEGGARPEFEEDVCAGRTGTFHRGVEADGFADVVHPVRDGRQFLRRGLAAQPGRDDRDRHSARGEPVDRCRELVQDRIHERGVEGVVDLQQLGRGAAGHEEFAEFDDLVAAARDHHRVGSVHGGDADAVVRAEQGSHVVLGGAHGEHRAALGDRLHDSPAGGHQPGRAVQVEGAGHMGGGDLAHRVADQVVGRPAELHHEAVQGDLQGEQRGLRDVGPPGPAFRGRVGEEEGLEHEGQSGVEPFADLVEAPREGGKASYNSRATPAH